MLKQLHISNYALIDELEVNFQPGFNVITGETGAGKSILLGALSFALGERADTNVLYDKEKKCVVEAHFTLTDETLKPLFEDTTSTSKRNASSAVSSTHKRKAVPSSTTRPWPYRP